MARVDNQGGSGFTVDNGTGLQVRTKLQQTIDALRSLQSGSGDPTVGVSAYQLHVDEVSNTSQILKIRNKANNDFITIGDVAQTNLGLLPRSGGTSVPMTGQFLASSSSNSFSPAISFDTDEDLGIFRASANVMGFSVLGIPQMLLDTTGLTLKDNPTLKIDSNNGNTVGIKSPDGLSSSLTLTLPGSIVNGGFLKTDASGNLSFSTISNAASALTGSTLASGVTASSLTSVGTLTALTVSGDSKLTTIKDASGNNPSTPAQLAQGRAKAWVNVTGGAGVSTDSSLSINNSFNVTSVTDKGKGKYRITYATAMENDKVCPVFGFSRADSNMIVYHDSDDSKSTDFLNLRTTNSWSSGGNLNDLDELYVAIFGD